MINLVVNLNKPSAISSHDAVVKVKKAFKVRKAGHAGTLDPMAEGVLLVCLNDATKITSYLCNADKEYITTAKLGEATDTFDAEGTIVNTTDCSWVEASNINAVLTHFIGSIKQRPPAFSAIKLNGKRAYELARKGINVKIDERDVVVHSIELLDFNNPFLTLRVVCNKGVYIRSIIHDIGQRVGVGAHIVKLIRTRVGNFTLQNSASLQELPFKSTAIFTIDSALADITSVVINHMQIKKILNASPVHYAHQDTPLIKIKDTNGNLIALGKCSNNTLYVNKLITNRP